MPKLTASTFEHQRAPYYKMARTEILKALASQRVDLVERLKACTSVQQMRHEADKQLRTDSVDASMRRIYKTCGKHFAEKTFNEVSKLKTAKKLTAQQLSEDYWFSYMDRFVSNKLANRITWITNTTEEQFKRAVNLITTEGLEQGYSIERMAQMIQDDLFLTEKYRAERIARTEVVSASNEASYAGAKATGLDLQKEWISFIDDRTRDSHIELDGKTAGMDEPFENGLMMPGDTSGEPEEVINCRCSIGYSVRESQFDWGRNI